MARVKVVPGSLTEAYKKRQGDFAPNLVGLQFTEGASFLGTSLFTFGNFEITSNFDNKLNKNFVLGGEWSNYYSLDNLQITQSQSEILLSNDIFVKLNFDPFNISRYVYFGSFYEYTRVALEQIIQKWKGSVYLNPTKDSNTPANTVLSFNYNSGNNTSEFLIPKSIITNNFELIVDANTDFTAPVTDIYNLSRDYGKYIIWNVDNNVECKVIGYTGSTTNYNYIRVKTLGNPFPSISGSTFGQYKYHLKPNNVEVQLFFEQLTDFEGIILNRLTSPIYTSEFSVPLEADGIFYYTTKSFSWPVTDGYNLDINTIAYTVYVENLLNATTQFDQYKTNLVSRRFVSESIHEYDTNGGGDPVYGMKVTKLLKIYGREFDEVKKYIDGISFANVVTYDKLDNTSDELIKIIAANLGFDNLLTVTTDNFNLLQITQPSFTTPFSGYSRSLSAKELDIELWRRIVINAWWLYKSKGTRKVIEFFLNLFKIPECVVSLNEYIYLAEDRLNTDTIYQNLNKFYEFVGGTLDTTTLPMDDYGFPKILPETIDNYFQMDGFWYNGGTESTSGNNPHIGPYDYGKSYLDQFKCFVPNFDQLVTASTTVTVNENYFDNYNKGTFVFDQNGLPVPYYGTGYATVLNSGLVQNAYVESAGLIYQGGTFTTTPSVPVPGGENYSMKIRFTPGSNGSVCATPQTCPITTYNNVLDYIIYSDNLFTTPLTQECCPYYWLPTQTPPPPPTPGTCPNQALSNGDFVNDTVGWVFGNMGTNPSVGNLYTTNGSPTNQSNIGSFTFPYNGENVVSISNYGHPFADFVYVAQESLIPGQTYQVTFNLHNDNGGTSQVPNVPPQTDVYIYAGTNQYGPFTFNDTTFVTHTIGPVTVTCDTNGWFVIAARQTTDTYKVLIGTVCVDAVTTTTGGGTGGGTTGTDFACYWCVTTRGDTVACNTDVYGTLYPNFYNGNQLSPTQILNANDLFNNIPVNCNNGSGIILDNVQGSLKTLNEQCCPLNGGTWYSTPYAQPVFGTSGVCIAGSTQTCTNSTYDPNNNVVVYTLNDPTTIISQECCTTLGYNWSSGDISIYATSPQQLIPDNSAISFLGVKQSYCTVCPTSIKFQAVQSTSNLATKSGGILDRISVVDPNTNLDLSQNCCTSYGFLYDTTTNHCYQCPATYNTLAVTVGAKTVNKLVVPGTTTSLSQSCCPGWFGSYGDFTQGCYECPLDPNNYAIVTGEILYNGQSIGSTTCCDYYKNNVSSNPSSVSWNSTQNKCLVSVSQGGGPTPVFEVPMMLRSTNFTTFNQPYFVDASGVEITGGATAIVADTDHPIEINLRNQWAYNGGALASRLNQGVQIPVGLSYKYEHILRVNIRTTGTINPLKLENFVLNIAPNSSPVYAPTYDSITNTTVSNVNNTTTDMLTYINIYYTGTNGTTPPTLSSTPVVSQPISGGGGIAGNAINQLLQQGDNYFWISFGVKNSAVAGHYLSARISFVHILKPPYNSQNDRISYSNVFFQAPDNFPSSLSGGGDVIITQQLV